MNEILQEEEKKLNIKKIIIISFIAVILIFGTTVTLLYFFNKGFQEWFDNTILMKTVYQGNTVSIDNIDENAQVFALDKYIVILQEKKLHFYNALGEEVDTISVDLNQAIWNITGKYAIIAEKNGNKFYVITGKNLLWQAEVDEKIMQVDINENGYVGVVTSDAIYKNNVYVFDSTGKKVIKTHLANTKVVDISISLDNKFLAIAEVNMSGVLIQSNVKVVSMEMAKTNPSEAIIYTYNADVNKLIVNIKYHNKNRIVCMYNDSIDIIDNQVNEKLIDIQDRLMSFATVELKNDVCVVEEVSTGDYTSDTNITIVNTANKKSKQYKVDKVAKEICTSDEVVGLNFGTDVYILNKNGWLLKKYISEQEINSFVVSNKIVGIIYRNKVEIIDL